MLEVGLRLSDAVPAIQELIAFVVIRLKSCLLYYLQFFAVEGLFHRLEILGIVVEQFHLRSKVVRVMRM